MREKIDDFLDKNLIFIVILFIAIFTRILYFGIMPKGLNQDEASIGYDAWSILHYGIDRNGIHLPIHLIAWGSGQNALYAYLSIPFILIFGLNIYTVRIVNLIFGISSIFIVYLLMNKISSKKTAYITMGLVATSPWHIMLSRWGLESNLFPAVFLIAAYVLVLSFENNKLFPWAAAIFAIALYSYGAAYVVVPLFCLIAVFYIIKNKTIQLKYILIGFSLFIIIAAPIYLFVLINITSLNTLRIGPFTIPKMSGIARLRTAAGSFNLLEALENIYQNVILQKDGTLWNSVPDYGVFYFISLPFSLIGLFKIIKERINLYNFIILNWLLCGLALFFIYSETNINRVNIIYIPIIMLAAIGIDSICFKKKILYTTISCYAILFIGFFTSYFGNYQKQIAPIFYSSLDRAICKADSIADHSDKVYITNHINMPYIYVLFFRCIPPEDFIKTVSYTNKNAEFQQVQSFGKYVFNTNNISHKKTGVYVLPNQEALQYMDKPYESYQYDYYTVIKIK